MSDAPHILVVDDDNRLRSLLTRFLRENNFAVSAAADAKEARALMEIFTFDLLVLDIMMPGESGLSFAEALKKTTAIPILFLSARTEAHDRVAGLELGADDYLTKPFEPKELLLRLRAILRRTDKPKTLRVTFGECVFDMHTQQLTCAGEPVYLTSAEATLLKALAERLGESVSRAALAELTAAGNERTVDVQITRLRKKVDTGKAKFLQTIRGEGYCLQGRYL